MPPGTADWDAKAYDRLAAPQEEWSRDVLARLPLKGDETVLDAGCGSGRVTKLLLDRLPAGRVIGIDGSESMVEEARRSLAAYGERVELVHSNLLELELEEPVDAVFSNAVFHWISDHDQLFRRLHATLKPGGRLAAQCGGEGNVANWVAAIKRAARREPFAAHLADRPEPWYYATVEETEARLRRAGFVETRCWLEERVVEPEDPRHYVAVVGLAAHHELLPPELREPFTDAVDRELPRPLVLRYVRLNIEARAAGGPAGS
ncbi:MAG TPA: methyltransferase domain-containing protein, partial [Solirubrobacterales bacterium]|nr:methyltransferase domain-containing protein [Solirubrobacterales bacterium]